MSQEGSSVKSLPPGKLENIKKLFEERDAQATGAPIFGASSTVTTKVRVMPSSTAAQPRSTPTAITSQAKSTPHLGLPINPAKPTPRVRSPARKTKQGSGLTKISLPASLSQFNQGSSETRPRRPSEKQDWVTLNRKLAAQKQLSPTVSRRVAQFTDHPSSSVESLNGSTGRPEAEHRFVSWGAKAGSPKRLSDSFTENVEETSKRDSAERRKTVDNISVSPDKELNTGTVHVSDRLKQFEQKSDLLRKPVPSVVSQNSPIVSITQRHLVKSARKMDESYNEPWDNKLNKAREQLKISSGNDRTSVPVIINTQAQNAQSLGSKMRAAVTVISPKSLASKQGSRPSAQPPPPPPSKPPRTYAHDDYLQLKGQDQSPLPSQSQNASIVKAQKPAGGVYNVKEKVSFLTDSSGDKTKVTMRTEDKIRYSHLKQTLNKEKETAGLRETPPSRPPQPPRPRPVSEGSALRKDGLVKLGESKDDTDSDSETEGPIVISLKHRRRIGHRVSVSGHHRNPFDQLPDTPGSGNNLQRFPLRKSYSSECLHTGSVSSLSDKGDWEYLPSSVMQSYRERNTGGGSIYEAVIDSDGYAVPNQFLRLPFNQENVQVKDSSGSSKPGFLRRILGVPSGAPVSSEVTVTPIKEQNVEKVPRRKMNLVKQKINQAYEVLNTVFRRPSYVMEGQEDDVDSFENLDSTDTESIVDVQEMERRVTYCSTVRLKTNLAIKKSREFLDRIYPQLFEYALIVGLCAKTDDPGYSTYVIHKFPETVESNVSVPLFCFPDAEEFRPGTATGFSESYSFVLTDIDGGRMFGYCRRMQPRDASLPEVICIISPVDAFNMYNKLLSEIEARRLKSLESAKDLIAASFGRPLPKPGKICNIRSLNESGELETLLLERPSDSHLANVNYESLLLYLGTDKLIKVFASMLMERRLIFCSKHLSILTQTIHALTALLYPFSWPHVYIPLLPPDMLEICAAPMPFMVGIMVAHLHRVTSLELEDVIIMDLDRKEVVRSMGDELTLLPKKVQKALKMAVNMCRIDSDAQSSQWLMVSEAFLRMFLETIGHFGQYISTQQDGTKTFLKDSFISAAPSKSIRQFLQWFTETQMFDVFIHKQLDQKHWGTMDLFLSRLYELQNRRQAEGSQAKGLGQRVKNLGKVIRIKLK